MVELMRHPLVDGAVNLDVNIITDVISSEVSGEGDGSLLPEGARERISGARSQTVTSRHGCLPRVCHSLSELGLVGGVIVNLLYIFFYCRADR